MTDEERDAILLELKDDSQEANEVLIQITTVLKGYNGNQGLCDKVDANCKSINKLWIAMAVMGASIGGSAYGIVKALIG